MSKRLMVLGVVLTVLLATASPTFAQEGPVTATGVLGEPYTVGEDPGLNYELTDEASGVTYVLTSGFVDLNPYVGQRITVEGVPVGGAGDAPPALNVINVQVLDGTPPAGDQYGSGMVDGDTTTGVSVLPDTGGISPLTLGLVSLLAGAGLMAYGFARQR